MNKPESELGAILEVKTRYKIYHHDEVNEAFYFAAEREIAEKILPRIPEDLRRYFDSEAYINDLEKGSGRGVLLATEDDEEHVIEWNGEYYYAYNIQRPREISRHRFYAALEAAKLPYTDG
jgi:hypothetical protein